jgi:drebrin-like protein
MTWSERQALAKKRAEEEEATSRAATAPALSSMPPSAPSAGRWGATAAAASIGSATAVSWEPEPEVTPDEEAVVRELPESQP